MTDAQHLFDIARRQFNEIADDVERHFELVADQLREWIPTDKGFPRLHQPAPKRLPPPTTLQAIQRWVSRHRALTAAAVAFIVTGSVGALVYVKSKQNRRKRRARKSASGARTDVVVVAGAVANPLTSALYLDLERRGFVVYVVASTNEDEQYIRSQSRADLLPLQLDLLDPFTAQQQMTRFQHLLARDHQAAEGLEPHKLNFVGLIVAPDTQSIPARIEDISSEEWSDALNAKVLNTIATTQLFLPSITEHKAKILFLAPSVTPSLKLPMHAIESTTYGALEGFTSSLAVEMKEDGVAVSQFKLGNIDIPSITAKQRREGQPKSRLRATPLRRLHDSVFDALVSSRPRRTWHIGRGSLAYDVIGSWMPAGALGWLMGAGRKPGIVEEFKDEDLRSSSGSLLTWEKVEQEA
jgi:NAD(P)-dependent dehydrogenase (short-subunit alcohol dehydrogenase family)